MTSEFLQMPKLIFLPSKKWKLLPSRETQNHKNQIPYMPWISIQLNRGVTKATYSAIFPIKPKTAPFPYIYLTASQIFLSQTPSYKKNFLPLTFPSVIPFSYFPLPKKLIYFLLPYWFYEYLLTKFTSFQRNAFPIQKTGAENISLKFSQRFNKIFSFSGFENRQVQTNVN